VHVHVYICVPSICCAHISLTHACVCTLNMYISIAALRAILLTTDFSFLIFLYCCIPCPCPCACIVASVFVPAHVRVLVLAPLCVRARVRVLPPATLTATHSATHTATHSILRAQFRKSRATLSVPITGGPSMAKPVSSSSAYPCGHYGVTTG